MLKRPESITMLCKVVGSSSNAQLRQYAAVILRKRLVKLRNWNMLASEKQQFIKAGLLQAIPVETEKSVRSAIAQVVGCLINHEFDKEDPWAQEVMKMVFFHIQSEDPSMSIIGSETLSTFTEAAPDQFVPLVDKIGALCSQAMMVSEQSNNMG